MHAALCVQTLRTQQRLHLICDELTIKQVCVGKCGYDKTNNGSTYLVDIHLLSSTLQLNCILKVLVSLVKSCCGIYGFGVFVFVPMGLKLLSIPAISDVNGNLN